MMRRTLVVAASLAVVAILPAAARGQAVFRDEPARVTVEPNVIYGMYSGLALLLDVYRPDRPNGRGIIVIPGSGWHAPLAYNAPPLKGARPGGLVDWFRALTDAGYTLFVINHRAAPRFHYPDPVHDAQRATRFVRHNAQRFGVDPERLGALGHSSGGHLVSMLGTLGGQGDSADADPVNRASARVQAVVAGAAPTDLRQVDSLWPTAVVTVLIGQAPTADSRVLYREASPIHHVSAEDAPFLLIHGDADPVVPFRNSELMHGALREAGVDAELVLIEGGGHGAFPIRRTVGWLNRRLLDSAAARQLEPLVSALDRLGAAEDVARRGEVEAALEGFRRASRESGDRLTIPASSWNLACWFGGLHGRARAAMPACERAVELAPDNPGIRDSRGLARALTGDARGAIADFEFFVSRTPPGAPARAEREVWLAALRAGRNPFTAEVLEQLRGR